jgi:hypothetical protein
MRMSSMRSKSLWVGLALITSLAMSLPARAGVSTAVIRELTEFVSKKFGKEVAEEGSEVVSRGIERAVAAGGDDAVKAIRTLGPRAIQLIDSAGDEAVQASRLLAQFGDEAVWVVGNASRRTLAAKLGDEAAEAMIKHGAAAEKVLELGGKAAANAAKNLSTREGRQLAMLAGDEATSKLVSNEALMNTVAKFGDKGMEFVWKNKGVLTAATVLAVFVADPEPFIEGTKSLAEVAAQTAVEPIAKGIAGNTNWTLTIVLLAGCLACYLLIKQWILKPRKARA